MGAFTGYSADQGRSNQREGNFTRPSGCCSTDIPSRANTQNLRHRVPRMRLQEHHTRAVSLCLELGHRDGPCPRPSSLSTTDYDDIVPTWWPNLTNTNHDGETLCASPGMQSLSVAVPAPSRTRLAALRRRRYVELIFSGGLGGGSALLAEGDRRRRSRRLHPGAQGDGDLAYGPSLVAGSCPVSSRDSGQGVPEAVPRAPCRADH